jgi:pSer/pThr/pTyr-binding forkhead associated (FHA) protein
MLFIIRQDDDGVDAKHAMIDFNAITNSYWLKDLGSRSGTAVNGRPLFGVVELKSGDRIRFGMKEFVFEMNSSRIASSSSKSNHARLPAVDV